MIQKKKPALEKTGKDMNAQDEPFFDKTFAFGEEDAIEPSDLDHPSDEFYFECAVNDYLPPHYLTRKEQEIGQEAFSHFIVFVREQRKSMPLDSIFPKKYIRYMEKDLQAMCAADTPSHAFPDRQLIDSVAFYETIHSLQQAEELRTQLNLIPLWEKTLQMEEEEKPIAKPIAEDMRAPWDAKIFAAVSFLVRLQYLAFQARTKAARDAYYMEETLSATMAEQFLPQMIILWCARPEGLESFLRASKLKPTPQRRYGRRHHG